MKDNDTLNELIGSLKMEKKGFWRKVAEELNRSRRTRVEVNLSKLEECASDGSVILVPGKVLGAGNPTKKMTVAAFSFSTAARKLIEASGGRTLSIGELLKSNKDAKDVIIIT